MKEQFPEVEASQLKAALKKGVTAKVLEQNGQRSLLKIFFNFRNEKKTFHRFWVAGTPPPPPPPEETVDIVEVEVAKPSVEHIYQWHI